MQFVKKKKKCACTPFAWQKASFSSFPSPSWECNSERHPGDWVTPRVSHSAVKSHLSWLGAYSTHLLEVSHFQHYILILVSGAHQEKLRQAVWDRRDFCTRMQILLSQSTDTDAAPKKKKKKDGRSFILFCSMVQFTPRHPPSTIVPSAYFSPRLLFSIKLYQYGISACPRCAWKAPKCRVWRSEKHSAESRGATEMQRLQHLKSWFRSETALIVLLRSVPAGISW